MLHFTIYSFFSQPLTINSVLVVLFLPLLLYVPTSTSSPMTLQSSEECGISKLLSLFLIDCQPKLKYSLHFCKTNCPSLSPRLKIWKFLTILSIRQVLLSVFPSTSFSHLILPFSSHFHHDVNGLLKWLLG